MSHQELQIAPGVYVTDFRKDGKLVGIAEYPTYYPDLKMNSPTM